MDVPNLFSASVTDQSTKRYLALVVTEDAVQAGLWEVAAGMLKLLVTSSVKTYSDHNNLVVEVDSALQELGVESEAVNEVLFGLPTEWVESAGVVDVKKPILKKITQDLSLKPVGFVVITEALAQQLLRDGQGVHSLVLWYQKTWLTVALIHRGVVKVCERIGRSHESVSDVQEALAHLVAHEAGKQLPSKVFLISLAESDDVLIEEQRVLTGYDWEKQSNFLQPPIFEILSQAKIVQALVGEGGAAVAAAQGLTIINRSLEAAEGDSSAGSAAPSREAPPQTMQQEADEETAHVDTALPIATRPVVPTPTQSLTEQQERAHAQLIAGVTSHNNVRQPALTQVSTFGIPIKTSYTGDGVMLQDTPSSSYSAAIHDYDEEDELIEPLTPQIQDQVVLPTWFSKHWHAVVVGLATGAAALVVLAVASVFVTKQAVVEVVLATKTISNEVEITLDPTLASSDLAKRLLKADLVDTQRSGSKTADTAGVKLVGEKASGTVSLLNKTSAPKTFAKGTLLQAGKKVFVTTQEVTVASASAKENSSGDAETKVYGKADVTIQAKEIGAEGNVGKDTEFEVDSFANSSFSAKATTEVTGGSSREVRVASEERDQAKLLTALQQELSEQAQKELSSSAGNGRYTIPTGKVTVEKTTYDAELGEEVKTLTLEATVTVYAVTYQADDLQPLVAEVLRDQIPSGFVLTDADPSILSAPAEGATASTKVTLAANVAATVKPVIDLNNLRKEIASQSVSSAQAILAGKGEIEAVKIFVTPWLASFISPAVPGNVDKITITEGTELAQDEQ